VGVGHAGRVCPLSHDAEKGHPRGLSRPLPRRQVYLDVALSGQSVTCYETVDGLEVRGANHRVYLLREYRRWQNRYWWNWGQELPEDLRFEPYTPPVCPWIAVA
jgi:hypothetical protein